VGKKVNVGRPFRQDSTLSKGKILDLALQLIEAEGEKAISFRTLAKKLDVTPMAVSHHVGNRQLMLESLVAQAFYGVSFDPEGGTSIDQLRFLLTRYCDRILKHPNLFKCVLADPSLMGSELIALTESIRSMISSAGENNDNDVLLNLIVDYTHGFALSASVTPIPNQLTTSDFLRSLNWILDRVNT